jgi:EAL domain-containing protein (putative c-di-GMP-specific phosphodiesterase class I)
MAATERQLAAEATVAAQERLIEHTANRRTRERQLVAGTLRSMRPGDLPEATAEVVCREVASVVEVAMAVLIAFEDDHAVVLSMIDGEGRRLEARNLGARGAYLRERAALGPWVERWLNPADHPYRTELELARVAAHAYAPLVVHGEVVGLLVVAASEPDAILKLTEWLPGLVEFAGIVAALIGPGMLARMTSSRQVAEIRALINGAGHRPVFQPIVELETGLTVGFEALTRFEDGASPEETFRAAHAAGLGPELELATLDRALVAARALPPGAWLDVNVAPATVSEPRLHSLLAGAGREIVLEITEHDEVRDYTAFRAAFAPLASIARLCVDDAGSGFASLRHLVELGPSFIKLDRSLITALDRDPARRAAVAGMVHYARAAGAQVVAEGIEELPEVDALRALGVNLGQGYLLGRPAPVAAFAAKAPRDVAIAVRHPGQRPRRRVAQSGPRGPIQHPIPATT